MVRAKCVVKTGNENQLDLAECIQITSHMDRLQGLEKDLAALKSASAAKEEVGRVRGEMKKVYVRVLSKSQHVEIPYDDSD